MRKKYWTISISYNGYQFVTVDFRFKRKKDAEKIKRLLEGMESARTSGVEKKPIILIRDEYFYDDPYPWRAGK